MKKGLEVNLFEKLVDDNKLHKNFISILSEEHEKEREVLNNWIKDFPDRDGKFVKEFQTTFNSSFWEIYLYALFREFNFEFDWKCSRPDFALKDNELEFIVEATIANNAQGKEEEWNKDILKVYDDYTETMNEKNIYSIIRLANSFLSKLKKYRDSYGSLAHVKGRPFVLAISPFEQPLFYHQYDRPIMALLYNYYVDEEAYFKNPKKYPDGPPGISLDSVEKENGSEIMLGMFMDERAKEVSAVIFNPLATWGKVLNLTDKKGFYSHSWITNKGLVMTQDEQELIEDGLFVFHNPFAEYPLPRDTFDRERVCQVFMEKDTLYLEKNFGEKHLFGRIPMGITLMDNKS